MTGLLGQGVLDVVRAVCAIDIFDRDDGILWQRLAWELWCGDGSGHLGVAQSDRIIKDKSRALATVLDLERRDISVWVVANPLVCFNGGYRHFAVA